MALVVPIVPAELARRNRRGRVAGSGCTARTRQRPPGSGSGGATGSGAVERRGGRDRGAFPGWLVWRGEPSAAGLPDRLQHHPSVVFVAARARGERLAHTWNQASRGAEALRGAVQTLREQLPPQQRATVPHLEVNLAHSFRRVDLQTDAGHLALIYRGLVGARTCSS